MWEVDCHDFADTKSRNDERVERLYFLQKQNKAKTFCKDSHFVRILFFGDLCDSFKVSDSLLIYNSPKWILRAIALSMNIQGVDLHFVRILFFGLLNKLRFACFATIRADAKSRNDDSVQVAFDSY